MPASEGLVESQFRRLEKKRSNLPTLWADVFMKIPEPNREVTDPDDEDCESRSGVTIRIILGGRQHLTEKLDSDPHKSQNSRALKGLSHEIDLKNVDENGQILAL